MARRSRGAVEPLPQAIAEPLEPADAGGVEADDVIGNAARQSTRDGVPLHRCNGDKDLRNW